METFFFGGGGVSCPYANIYIKLLNIHYILPYILNSIHINYEPFMVYHILILIYNDIGIYIKIYLKW